MGPTLVQKPEPFAFMIVPAQLSQFGGQRQETLRLGTGGQVRISGDFAQQSSEGQGDRGRQPVGQRAIIGLRLQIGALFDESARKIEGILVAQPVQVTAGFPLREILFADGLATELRHEHGANFRERVEPPT